MSSDHNDRHIERIFGFFEGDRESAHIWKKGASGSYNAYARFFDTGFRQLVHRIEDEMEIEEPYWDVSFAYEDFIFVRGNHKFKTSKEAKDWVSEGMTEEDEMKLERQFADALAVVRERTEEKYSDEYLWG